MLPYNRKLKQRSRTLRSQMTDAEGQLWTRVRRKQLLGVQFYRQKPLGNFIVDFYAPKARLVVEADGGQHFDAAQRAADAERTAVLAGMGLRVLRFANDEVLAHTDGVVAEIFHAISAALRSGTNAAAVAAGTNPPAGCAATPFFKGGEEVTLPRTTSEKVKDGIRLSVARSRR